MAYRKTEKVLQQLQARRDGIIASSIDVIAKVGIDSFTADLVAERAGIASGLIYRYFADKNELLAAVIAHLLKRDTDAMAQTAAAERDQLTALASVLLVLFNSFSKPRLVRALAATPAYRLQIISALEVIIKLAVDLTPKERHLAAAGALGALYGVYDVGTSGRSNASAAVLIALRGIGISDAQARRVVERSRVAA